MSIKFHLYSSEGCHLCEQAFSLCQELSLEQHISVIDIVEDKMLVEQYGTSIPVLARLSDNKKLFWPFTISDIQELNN